MYDINTILASVNAGLSVITLGAVLGIWRVRVRLAKEERLIRGVGPVPLPPQPVDPILVKICPVAPAAPVQPIQPADPIEVKGEKKPKTPSPKAKKQIDLLTAELERLQSL